jgi:predicted dehydrogenase
MKTYVVVGTGGRSIMYLDALCKQFNDCAKLVAVCDKNKGRLGMMLRTVHKYLPDVVSYSEVEFDEMLEVHKPDYVIVTTRDCDHHTYICKALKAGCDVITEKPMTTDSAKCQQIVDTVKETGKKVRVTFNYRYSPPRTQIKELLMSGIIGRVLSASFQWNLDTKHGADYFHRWHRNKATSGGLLVHKATHHFDIMNWWLGATPETVYAEGGRLFYNNLQSSKYELNGHAERCRLCPSAQKCNFCLDIDKVGILKQLYMEHEKHDGYYRYRGLGGRNR